MYLKEVEGPVTTLQTITVANLFWWFPIAVINLNDLTLLTLTPQNGQTNSNN